MHLDLEQVNALSPDDRNRYMQLEKMFALPGWKVVVALAQENAAAAFQQAALASNWDANRMALGNHLAWRAIANLEKDTQALYTDKALKNLMADDVRRIAEEHSFE